MNSDIYYEVCHQETLFKLFQLAFGLSVRFTGRNLFGNSQSDAISAMLSPLILYFLNRSKFPNFKIDDQNSIFLNRVQFENYLHTLSKNEVLIDLKPVEITKLLVINLFSIRMNLKTKSLCKIFHSNFTENFWQNILTVMC